MLNVIRRNKKLIIKFDSFKTISIINDVIRFLNKCKKEGNRNIVFDLCKVKSQSYTSVHVTLSGVANYYVENHSFNIEFKTRKNQYVSCTNIKSPRPALNKKNLFEKNIFDKVITFSNGSEVEFISKQILLQLKKSVECEEGVLVGLSWCINEIMDNVLNHSFSKRGYIMAQIHRTTKHIVISIFDTGIGLYRSILSSNEYNPTSEVEAIELVLGKGVTCNKELGQGNGLWGLKEIVKYNHGYLSIMTGRTNINFDFENNNNNTDFNNNDSNIVDKIPVLDNNNLCTRIDFTLNFSKLIDVNRALDNYVPFELITKEVEDMITETGWLNFKIKDEATEGTGTRSSGMKLRTYILNMLKIDPSPILLNFENVETISSSFADEFIGKLILSIGFVQFSTHFRIINANSFVSGLINKAIIERQNQKNY